MSDKTALPSPETLRALLALREAGTPGDWYINRGLMSKSLWITCWWREQRMRGKSAEGPITSVSTERYVTDGPISERLSKLPIKKAEDDAKLIVGAVNALPMLVNALLSPDQVDEAAWLIEWPADKHAPLRYYAAGEQAVMSPNDATRFCRKKDAEAVSRAEKITGARVVEHLWMSSIKAPAHDPA